MSHPSRRHNIAFGCLDRQRPGRVAAIFADADGRTTPWTYGELSLAAARFAAGLARRGIRKGDRIMLSLPNGPEFPIAFFGAIRKGVIPIPVSPFLTKGEMAFLRRDSGARLVLDRPEQVRGLLGSETAPSVPVRQEDHAFWLYTSGTEGRPKAVIHAHRSIPAHDARSRLWMDLKRDDVVFNTSALNWSYALTCGLADPLRKGACSLILQEKPDPKCLLEVIDRHRVTIFMSVPGLYRRLAEYCETRPKARRLLRSVRVCLSAGEKLPTEIRARFQNATGLTIREGLGMTEHSVYLVQPKGRRVVEGSCGRVLPGHRIAILQEDLQPSKTSEIGILASHRSCPGLMLGYYRRTEEQKRVFRGEWFLSGDLAYRDASGNFFYIGRRDDVITAGGYRISPMEVEAVLNAHPAVREAAAIGREVGPGKTVVCSYAVLKKGRRPSEPLKEKIIGWAGQRLARYKTPREIIFVKELSKTTNGKMIRKRFRSA
jgi:acyl-coenzyme A synthetase/AMP-(fatty) acid ligase